MGRQRDIGRLRAYRAEALAFGGAWFEMKCLSPLLTEAEARALHIAVATFLGRELKVSRALPAFEITKGGRSYFRWQSCYYRLEKLRVCVVLHEVAHWATSGSGDTSHGKTWQNAFALAIREFVNAQTADLFLKLCEKLPVMRVAAGPKRRWILQERSGEGWETSQRSRSAFENAEKLRMWRGYVHYDGLTGIEYRMVRDLG